MQHVNNPTLSRRLLGGNEVPSQSASRSCFSEVHQSVPDTHRIQHLSAGLCSSKDLNILVLHPTPVQHNVYEHDGIHQPVPAVLQVAHLAHDKVADKSDSVALFL